MLKSTYIIGEIGQNHNGDVEIAKKLIDVVAAPVIDHLFGQKLMPMNAIKMTRRDLNEELSASEMLRPYDNPNSFGKTYGEHRAFLELNDEQHFEVYQYAQSKGLEVVETLCAKGCLSMLRLFIPDRLKVASRDLTNLPLLEAMAETKIPIIFSTGMTGQKELDDALEVVTKYHENISILHCLSQYPSEYKNINLLTVPYLKEHYPQYAIGYSDHSIGILMPAVAVGMGAKIIEKHITLDRNMKGTDHRGSLEPDGIWRMVRDIRNTEYAIGQYGMFVNDEVKATRIKLERSLATLRPIASGEIITENDLHMLSPGDGFKWANREQVVGRKALTNIPADEIIYPGMIES
jgi:sialic acid synthase